MGLCLMALWRPSTSPAPRDPARAAKFSQTQGCFCWQATKDSSPTTAALEACVAQEVKGSESWTGPSPDGERWPHEWRKLFTAWNVDSTRLHDLVLQLASPDTEGLFFFFQDSDRDSWKHVRAGCVQQIHVEKICCWMSGTTAEHFSTSLFVG